MPVDLFSFTIDGVDADMRIAKFVGYEKLSDLYCFNITIIAEDPEIDFASAIGQTATLKVFSGEEARVVHGVVNEFEQGGAGKKVAAYRVSIVPEMWRLQNKRNFKIFQEATAPDIITEVLDNAALTVSGYEMQVQGQYRTREYCVQYGESDWDFICRLMEEEGIFFFFCHEEATHTLTICDAKSAYTPIVGDPHVVYREPVGILAAGEHVSHFTYREGTRPGKVAVKSWAFKTPDLDLNKEVAGADDPDLEIYDFRNDYEVPEDGEALAQVDLERWQVERKVGWGEGRCARLVPGQLFTLADHPRGDFNKEYLITMVEHAGSQPLMSEAAEPDTAGYENRFKVIPNDVEFPFRPPLHTPKPKIDGVQTAIVVGPDGEEIHTDEHGRIKVQFHWDRYGVNDDQSSCWIRVSQLWAGAAWGAMFIPRIGHEVVVTFIEGDPDRPLVVGRVYHGTNVPPYTLPDEKTKSTIKSATHPGSEGSNELRFEDQQDEEEIYLHGQKDWNIVIENDKTQEIGNDETLHVVHDRNKWVDNDQSETIGNDKTIAVTRDHTEEIGRHESLTIAENATRQVGGNQSVNIDGDSELHVVGNETETIDADMTVAVGGNYAFTVSGDASTTIEGNNTLAISGNDEQTVDGNRSVSVAKNIDVAIDKNLSETIGGQHSASVAKKFELEVGSGKVTVEKSGKITIEGKDITIKGGGKINIQASSKVQLKSDGPVDVNAGGNVTVKGGTVAMN